MSSIKKIIIREFKQIGKRKTLFLLEIVFPIIIFFLFAEIYKQEVIRELPVAIYDADNSSLSRKIERFIDASPTMQITENLNSIQEIKNDFKKGKIKGAFVFPRNFEKQIKSGLNSNIIIYKNSSNIIVGTYLFKESAAIIKTVSAGVLIKKLNSNGQSSDQAMATVNPIQIKTVSLYNPTYSYENYLMPGLVTFTLQMMIMIAAVIILSSEFTHNTFGELVKLAENKAYRIFIGKSVPHLIIHFASIVLILGVIFPLYNIKIKGSIIDVYILLYTFIISIFMVGFLISTIIKDQLLATEIVVFINTPAFIFSGFTFPIWGMPFLQSVFAQLLPFTHFLTAFLKVYQMGAPLSSVFDQYLIISLFGFVSIIGIMSTLKIKIKRTVEGI